MPNRTKSKPLTVRECNEALLEAERTDDTLLGNLAAFAMHGHMRRIKRECREGTRELLGAR